MSCPICDASPDPKYRPFCSRRCADIDLGRWLSESYTIPAEEEAPDPRPHDGSAIADDRPLN